MILNYIGNPAVLIIAGIIMVMALIFHNMLQAYVASRLGDPSPKLAGFASFDPQRHLDPIGVLFLLLLGFGWPRAIPVNSLNYAGRGRQEAWVWLSGVGAYLLVGFVCFLLAAVFSAAESPQLEFAFIVASSRAVLHAVINLFPLLPLDMGRAVLAWGNPDLRRFVLQIAQYGVLGFMVFFFVLSMTGVVFRLESIFLSIFDRLVSLIPGL